MHAGSAEGVSPLGTVQGPEASGEVTLLTRENVGQLVGKTLSASFEAGGCFFSGADMALDRNGEVTLVAISDGTKFKITKVFNDSLTVEIEPPQFKNGKDHKAIMISMPSTEIPEEGINVVA